MAGGAAADEGNVISGTRGDGVQITGLVSSNVVAGDEIGTEVTGRLPLGNAQAGVLLYNWASSTQIGGTDPGDADVIAANGGWGIMLNNAYDDAIEGDFIGTDSTGTMALGNAQGGVDLILDASDNTIGGTTAAAGNLITDNGGPGVAVGEVNERPLRIGDMITANRIFGNAGQAIDLGDDGVSPNRSFNQAAAGAQQLAELPHRSS